MISTKDTSSHYYFFSVNFTSIKFEGERVRSGQNERTWGEGRGVLENEQGQTRGEGGGQNTEILSERTFWMTPYELIEWLSTKFFLLSKMALSLYFFQVLETILLINILLTDNIFKVKEANMSFSWTSSSFSYWITFAYLAFPFSICQGSIFIVKTFFSLNIISWKCIICRW